MNLEEARKKIDTLNEELVALFEERLQLTLKIAKYKEEHNLRIFDEAREKEILQYSLAHLSNTELEEYVADFMQSIMRISRNYQKDHIHQHIFLVGMPGSGKTTIGKALAQRQGMEFFDVDGVIQDKTGKTLQNIIIHDGEEAFRELEYEAIKDIVLHQKPSVIATGGGTVLSEKTVNLMRESGFVVCIERDVTQILDDLDMEIRPLLKESIEYIFRLYEERRPLYEQISHVQINNISNISDAVEAIVKALPASH